MFCKFCGAELSENTNFCTKCGEKVHSSLPAIKNKKMIIIALILVIIIVAIIIAANIHICDQCGRVYFGKGIEVFGETICKKCFEAPLDFGDIISGLF